MSNLSIEIASVAVNVYIDSEFKNIVKLFDKFKKTVMSKNTRLKIIIKKGGSRSVKILKDCSELEISGSDIDDLNNPFNLIGIFQATFRFIGIHSIKHGILLVHGSTAKLNGKTICFGDDSKNQGKTLLSIECALVSKEYIGDEFCFLDTKTWNICSYSFIPLHLRPQVKKHLTHVHGLELPKTNFSETGAGYFVEPGTLFRTIETSKLDVIVFAEFRDSPIPKIRRLRGEEKKKLILSCLVTHILKLFYPSLDRMKFDSSNDTKEVPYKDSMLSDLATKIKIDRYVKQVSKNMDAYRTTIKEPCEITTLFSDLLFDPVPNS